MTLLAAIREHRVGEVITVTYVRGGKTESASVTLADNTSIH